MKSIVPLLGLVFAVHAHAATAYEALHVLGKEHGEAVLDNVVEVRGTGGAPTPRMWRIVVKDKEARSGIREYDVQGTKLVGDRAASEAASGRPFNMNHLNLDSDGAHTVAEREAKKSGYAYDHVDYVLRGGGDGSKPMWEVRLVDERSGKTATLSVGADSGKMITARGLKRNSTDVIAEGGDKPRRKSDADDNSTGDDPLPPPPTERQTAEVRRRREKEADTNRPAEEQRPREAQNNTDKPGNKFTRFFERAGRHIGNAFQRAGDGVGRVVNGGDRPPAPPPRPAEPRRTARDANGTEYYRPKD